MATRPLDLLEQLEALRPPPIGPLSVEAYLALSEHAADRYEYVGGFAYAMGGGTIDHHDISFNIASALRARCAGTPCRTYTQIFRVRTPRDDMYLPDVMVACGQRPPRGARHLDDPCVLIEVLSPSTTRTDVMEKRLAYQEIPSARTYLIVESAWRAVHRHWRDDAGLWQRETITDAIGVVPLPCPGGAVLTLDEIYADADVPTDPPRPWRVFEQPDTTTAGAS